MLGVATWLEQPMICMLMVRTGLLTSMAGVVRAGESGRQRLHRIKKEHQPGSLDVLAEVLKKQHTTAI